MDRGATAAVPSSQQDELEDDPQFAPQLQLAPPKPKRQRTKSTSSSSSSSSKAKKSKEVSGVVQKRKPAPKVTKSSLANNYKLDKPQAQAPKSDSSSSALDRYRYQPRPAALEQNDSNAPYKQPRKRSRDTDQKRADRGGSSKGEDETKEATTSKQVGKRARRAEEIVFTIPELDEDGEPIVPPLAVQVTLLPIAEAPPRSPTPKRRLSSEPVAKSKKNAPIPSSSAHSKSSIELPPGMQARLRRDSSDLPSSTRPPQDKLTSKAPANTALDATRAHERSPITPQVPRTAQDEQEIAGCLEALQNDDFGMFELEEDLVEEETVVEAESDPRPPSPRPAPSTDEVEAGADEAVAEAEVYGDDQDHLPSPIASPDPFALDDEAAVRVPPRLDPHAFELIMAGREPSTSSSQPHSDLLDQPKSTPSLAQPHPRRSTAAPIARPLQPPPQDLLAALAANPSPPRPRPTHRLVPLTTSGLASHLEALVSSHVAEAASYKSRVASLEKSLKARDEEIGALSAGLRQVKGDREALEREVQEGKQAIEGWKGKADVLKEVRRGLLGEVQERDVRIAELEKEKEEWDREERVSGERDEAGADDDSSRQQDVIAETPAIDEDIEHHQGDVQRSDTIDANAELQQIEQAAPREDVKGAPDGQIEQDVKIGADSDVAMDLEKKDEAGPRVEHEGEDEGTR